MPIIEMFEKRPAAGLVADVDPSPLGDAGETATDELVLLRRQIMDLRATVLEQEESISFLRDLLAQRWFDAAAS